MFADLHHEFKLEVLTDASAAKGIASRRGLGKVRHFEVHYLWVQDHVANGTFSLRKVWGKENPADLMTKGLPASEVQAHLERLGFEASSTRSVYAPKLSWLNEDKEDNDEGEKKEDEV